MLADSLALASPAGGDAVVQSPRGAAQLGVHVLRGRVERRLHLRRALPAEVWLEPVGENQSNNSRRR